MSKKGEGAENASDGLVDCLYCGKKEDGCMVQCDACNCWAHFGCAGVTSTISNEEWKCGRCRSGAIPNCDRSGQAKEKAQNIEAVHNERSTREQSKTNKNGATAGGEVSEAKSRSGSAKLKKSIKIQLELLEQKRQAELSYLDKRYELLRRLQESDDSDEDIDVELGDFKEQRTLQWAGDGTMQELGLGRHEQSVGLKAQEQTQTSLPQQCVDIDNALSSQQLSARRVVPRELPPFSGSPEEWPLFISSYENSTRLCGFSNDENLLRLQRALKGRALDSVGSKLLVPDLVPEAIATLRMLFGRPEQIINCSVAKMRLQPNVNSNKLETLITFALELNNLTATMKATGLKEYLKNPMLVRELVEKLPAQMRMDWIKHQRLVKSDDLASLSDWLFELAEAASAVASPAFSSNETDRKKGHRIGHHYEEQIKPNTLACYYCEGTHFLFKCQDFKKLSFTQKWEKIKQLKLCCKCLKKHDVKFCNERRGCKVNGCTKKHHYLLHKYEDDTKNDERPSVIAAQHQTTSEVLYRIIPVTVHGQNSSCEIYAFCDDGSGPTVVEKKLLRQLGLDGRKSDLCLRWTDGTTRLETDSDTLSLKVSPRGKSGTTFILNDVRSVTTLDLPSQTMDMVNLTEKYRHLRGVPVESYHNVVPRMIIGLNNKGLVMPLKYREGKLDEPAATKTRLGWTVYGVTNGNSHSRENSFQLHICECDDDIALQRLVTDIMKTEEEIEGTVQYSPKDVILKDFIVRKGEKFVAKLLWKTPLTVLPDNYPLALQRLKCFERRLKKETELRDFVNAHIIDMQVKGYARKLSTDEIVAEHRRKWYLPIFCVRNLNKPGKIRMVWDAAALYKGVSLNTCLDKGPDMLNSLVEVLFNFRTGKIGICGDICEMFHRISIDENDQQAHRFLWRNGENRNPDVYVLQVLSFGASCSPALAQSVKNYNAIEFEHQYPRAAKSIIHRHYMDDMLDSVDTVPEAIRLGIEVRNIHKKANFHIRNWLSNSVKVSQALGEPNQTPMEFCKAGKQGKQLTEPNKVLGLWWDTSNDIFTFNLKFTKANEAILQGSKLPSKRQFLRILMSIFDPLGFLSFYLIEIKILFQQVWRSGIGWDEDIPFACGELWKAWLAKLPQIMTINVPRHYFTSWMKESCHTDLHVFVDASENAYAAVAYFRIQNGKDVKVTLVCSKAKVAPLRPLSIPRMELMAAVLGVRLGNVVKKSHDLNIRNIRYWSDSKTVLWWLRSDPKSYKQFVMFRIGEVQELSTVDQWDYIPTKLNIADMATKVTNQSKNIEKSKWFTGPDFLWQPPEHWPNFESISRVHEDSELRNNKSSALLAVQSVGGSSVFEWQRYSNWERILKTTAYIKLFIENCKSQGAGKEVRALSADDLQWSHDCLCRLAQAQRFPNEIVLLQQNKNCNMPKNSPLKHLSPFIDKTSIVRIKGRLENIVGIDSEKKNPIILPKSHPVTIFLIDYFHRKYKHIHHETVINELHQIYYIPGLRKLLRTIRSTCQTCLIRQACPQPPEMGDLPTCRVSPYCPPFSHVGLDFFGPFITTIGRKTEKRYGVVFTCLTCRAVHIEMAYSLTTSSCSVVIRNFLARRGTPKAFYSDNGTNLKGAEKELRKSLAEADFGELRKEFTTADTSWKFNPPASPHMGGAWERLVRSIKRVMYQIITPETRLTDEKLHNLLLEVEHIINSRPLTYLSLDTAEQEALTPNHFLLGSSSGQKPPGEFTSADQLRHSWRHSQLLADRFWHRWVQEVLPTLTRRTKWFNKVKPIEVGDIVIIVDPAAPRYSWPKGVIEKTIPGSNGQTRSVWVRTANGLYHRPAAKIAVLDVTQKQN